MYIVQIVVVLYYMELLAQVFAFDVAWVVRDPTATDTWSFFSCALSFFYRSLSLCCCFFVSFVRPVEFLERVPSSRDLLGFIFTSRITQAFPLPFSFKVRI